MSEIHSAVGGYVTHSLDADDQAEFEIHLAGCESCQREVAEFRATLAELSALTVAAPPPELRAAVLSGIHQVRPLPPEVPAGETPGRRPPGRRPPGRRFPSRRCPSRRSRRWTSTRRRCPGTCRRARHPRRWTSWRMRRRRRLTRVLTGLAAAAVVVALALGGVVYQLAQQRQALVAQQQMLVAGAQQETELLSAPDLEVVTSTVDGAAVSYLVSRQRSQAMFVGTSLPSPGAGRTYQLWTVRGTTVTPDRLIGTGGTVRQWFDGAAADATQLAVSIEPSGGSTTPSDIRSIATL